MDDINYVIHSVSEDEVPAIAVMHGSKVEVKVRRLLIEAVSEDESMSHIFRIVNGDAAKYAVGGKLKVQLVPGK